MKIQDLITLKKITEESNYANGIEKKYFKKKGYFWSIPCHSANESMLLNNYEKDCVVAYLENKHFIAFLIKTGGSRYRGFCYLKGFLKNVCGAYTYDIQDVYKLKDILNLFKEDTKGFVIADEEEYDKVKKFLVLEGMGL